ncbi:HAD family hydrolase [Prosthecobacter sp.]|uniref:HAD family hydrolase n=1 Tax=Prosthecobacter sp. TaxID=1965333 RepID=UPI0037834BBD
MAAPKHRFILCFDFDGTLVHPESEPIYHPGFGQMIQLLRSQGAAWVINTGRSLSQTLQGLAQYGIFYEPDFIIAQESDIYKPGFFSRWTDYGSWNRQARRAQERFAKDHQQSLLAIRHMVETQTNASFITGSAGEMGIVGSNDLELDGICAYIDTHARQYPEIGYHRNGIYLRFSHSGYSKGTALSELARLLGLDSSACFAAGDNFNDLSMLDPRHARMIACPSNSVEPVKQIVRSYGGYIASRPASEGMMEALTHFFGNSPAPAA